jgi:hypothetical protein
MLTFSGTATVSTMSGTLAEQISTKLVVLALGISVNKQSFHVGKVFRIWILRKVLPEENGI